MKIKHILKSREFSEVFEKARRISGDMISLYVLREPRADKITVGIVVSKKCAQTAVRRNYVKRLIYGYFSDNNEKINPEYRIVVRAIRDLGTSNKRPLSLRLRKELDILTKKAGMIR